MKKSNKHYYHKHMSSEDEDGGYIRNPSSDTQQGSLSEEEEWSDDAEDYGTPIRSRIRFSPAETKILEDTFRKNKRPSTDIKQKLAVRFETNVSRIQIWFQNRRAKEKKLKQQTSDGADGVDGEHHDHEDGVGSSSRDGSRSSTRSNRTREPDCVPDSHIAAQRGRKRRQEDDDGQYPAQLRSSQQRRHSQYNVPTPTNVFYHSSGARSAEYFPYYPPQHRHSDPGLMFENYGTKYYYSPSLVPTVNPQDMIFSNTEDYISNNPTDPFTPSPSTQQQLNMVDSNKYILNDDGYEIMAEPSPSSRNSQGVEPQQASILAHDGDPPPLVEVGSSATKKGDL